MLSVLPTILHVHHVILMLLGLPTILHDYITSFSCCWDSQQSCMITSHHSMLLGPPTILHHHITSFHAAGTPNNPACSHHIIPCCWDSHESCMFTSHHSILLGLPTILHVHFNLIPSVLPTLLIFTSTKCIHHSFGQYILIQI